MAELATLLPDLALANALDKTIEVRTSATDSHTIRVVTQGGKSNKLADDEFVVVSQNGNIRSLTRPIGVYEGEVRLTIYCKLQDDGRVRQRIVQQIVAQIQSACERRSIENIVYAVNTTRVITPTTPNYTIGYSMTIFSVEWHTTN